MGSRSRGESIKTRIETIALCYYLGLGVDAVKFDVRKTKDNKIVVIPDDKVDRTTNGKGLVNELALNEIKLLATEERETIPALEETLDFLDMKTRIS